MWSYHVVTNVRPDNYDEVCQQVQSDGYSLEESNHYVIVVNRPIGTVGPLNESRWTLVFRKPGGQDLATGNMNRAYDKLREVGEQLQQLVPLVIRGNANRDVAHTMGQIQGGIDRFLFEGSPDDR